MVYLDPTRVQDPPEPFRTGQAGTVRVGQDGGVEAEPRVWLSANSTHALLGHGVVDALNRLPVEGHIGGGLPVVLPPAALDDVSAVLHEADRKTYGRLWDFAAGQILAPEPIEYRVRVDNREYQVTLARLQYLVGVARRTGLGAWIRI